MTGREGQVLWTSLHPFIEVSSITLSNYWSSSPVSVCRYSLTQGKGVNRRVENEICPHISKGNSPLQKPNSETERLYSRCLLSGPYRKSRQAQDKGIDVGAAWATEETLPSAVEYFFFMLLIWAFGPCLFSIVSPNSGVTFLHLLSWYNLAF